MKHTAVIFGIGSLIFGAIIASSLACVGWGKFATAEDQAKWGHPCEVRGERYDTPCIDDPTEEGAYEACPCYPALPRKAVDGGIRDAAS